MNPWEIASVAMLVGLIALLHLLVGHAIVRGKRGRAVLCLAGNSLCTFFLIHRLLSAVTA